MNRRKVIRALSTPVTLIVLLAIMATGVVWGYKAITARVVITRPACSTMTMTELTTSSVTVNVFNAGSLSGLAGQIAASLSKGGFVIGTVDNTTEKVETTLIVGTSADDPEVQLVAAWFTDPLIRADGRTDHSVDVMVGNSYNEKTGMAAKPPTSLEIPGGVICLPTLPPPTPTPTPTSKPT